MNTWIIVEMNQNRFDKSLPTDPKTLYNWSIEKKDSSWTTSSGMSYAEVLLLMQYFGVTEASELVGKTFESEKGEASSALNLLLTQIRHGGNYEPPTHGSLRRRAAQALAKMKAPDFSDVDDETIAMAFQEVWEFSDPKSDWLDDFKGLIFELSDRQVRLRNANPSDFPVRVKGPAYYGKLVSFDGTTQKVIIGPYSHPVEFIN